MGLEAINHRKYSNNIMSNVVKIMGIAAIIDQESLNKNLEMQ